MKKTWLWSSGIFIFQLAIFFIALALPIAEQGKSTVALGIVSVVTFVILLVAVISVPFIFGRINAVFALVAAAAFFGALAATFALINRDFFDAISAFSGIFAIACVMAFLATLPAANDDPEKPRWAHLIAALPLGIGVIAGGPLLLIFAKKKDKEEERCHRARIQARRQDEEDRKKYEGTPPVIPWPGNDTPTSSE